MDSAGMEASSYLHAARVKHVCSCSSSSSSRVMMVMMMMMGTGLHTLVAAGLQL